MGILIPIKKASQTLNISIRAIQIKCKKQGIVKIGNQYQITNDILDEWIKDQETKSEAKQDAKQKNHSISHPKQYKLHFATSQLLIAILFLLFLTASIILYYRLSTEIDYFKQEKKETDKEHKKEIKSLNKRLFDAYDVIQHQEIEIQYLKMKDSIQNKKIKL